MLPEELPGSVGAFLRAVARELPGIGTRDVLRVARLLQAGITAPDALRVMVVSSLARGQAEWERIDQIYRASFPTAPVGDAAPDGAVVRLAPPSRLRRLRARLRDRLLTVRSAGRSVLAWGGLLVVFLAVVGVGSVLLSRWLATHIDPPPPPAAPRPRPPPPEPIDLKTRVGARIVPWKKPDGMLREEAQERVIETPRHLRQTPWLLGLYGLCVALWALALRLWGLGPQALSRRAREAAEHKERARMRRRALLQDREDGPTRPPYRVQARYLRCPFPARALEDSAVLLGRLALPTSGDELAVPETLAETLDAGGRFQPVYQRRSLTRPLLALVDEEAGSHPFLGAVWLLLGEWRRRGVRVFPYRFRSDPSHLRDDSGTEVALADLPRLHGGAALIVLARRLALHGPGLVPLGWPAGLVPFAQRAWLDLDPRADAERDPLERGERALLEAQGLPAFPFTPDGIVALARAFRSGRLAESRVPPAPLRPLVEVYDLCERWARAAAVVPDASWDQLEALRQRDSVLAEGLPDFRSVQRLLDYVAVESRRLGVSADGLGKTEVLTLPEQLLVRLRAAQRLADGPDRTEEKELCTFLSEQLGDAPADELLRWHHDVRAACLAVLKDHRRVLELLRFQDSPVAHELWRWLRREKKVQATAPLFSEADWAVFEPQLQEEQTVLWHELWRSLRRPGWRPFFGALPLAALSLAVALGGLRLWGAAARVPPIMQVERVEERGLPETKLRPKMLVIPAGRFLMGSPPEEKGRDKDEQQHPVTISRPFLLAETEVTQAQFKAVMGENPVAVRTWGSKGEYKCSDQGVDQAGDKRLPVWCVDFLDAVRYVNQLSTQEKLTPCYEIKGTQVYFKGLSCPGYRLPTEAEWEYAARANQPTLYAGSDDPKAVAWFDENSEGRPHPVATRQANAFLLHDMSGNLWEWVWDVYRNDYEKDVAVDPQGDNEQDSARARVLRGGSWVNVARYRRVANRNWYAPSNRGDGLGFRPARSLP